MTRTAATALLTDAKTWRSASILRLTPDQLTTVDVLIDIADKEAAAGRYQDAADLASDLVRFLSGLPGAR